MTCQGSPVAPHTLLIQQLASSKHPVRAACIQGNVDEASTKDSYSNTTKDVNLAEAIFGPDIGTLKGKTVNQRPPPVVDTTIEVPKELLMYLPIGRANLLALLEIEVCSQ